MVELKVEQDDAYTVCNGVMATKCAKFVIYGRTIWVHRPVDDKKTTRLHGWQYSVDGVPISYLGGIGLSRNDAVIAFIMQSMELGAHTWNAALEKTVAENRRRLADK